MRTIVKHTEPASLVEYRTAPHSNFDGYRDKDGLRERLVAEQHGICCYCLSRIRPSPGSMKIEHWQCQERYPVRQLDYANLLGACKGGEGQPRRNQHCDTYKANADLSRNPADPTHRVEDLIHYDGDGSIGSPDATLNVQLNNVLNLNTPHLKASRRATLEAFKETLEIRGKLQRGTLERWFDAWNNPVRGGELRPFCQVIVYWLRKRLTRA